MSDTAHNNSRRKIPAWLREIEENTPPLVGEAIRAVVQANPGEEVIEGAALGPVMAALLTVLTLEKVMLTGRENEQPDDKK